MTSGSQRGGQAVLINPYRLLRAGTFTVHGTNRVPTPSVFSLVARRGRTERRTAYCPLLAEMCGISPQSRGLMRHCGTQDGNDRRSHLHPADCTSAIQRERQLFPLVLLCDSETYRNLSQIPSPGRFDYPAFGLWRTAHGSPCPPINLCRRAE